MVGALALAKQALFTATPNPRVGCVIFSPEGEIIGMGATQQAGGPHAEIVALSDAVARGVDVAGSVAFVTLEPCSHHGRTGPCCDALIRAGVSHVVAAMQDPNPLVAGAGFARLRAAGITVTIGDGAAESRELNIGFFSRMIRGRPWIRLKAAASLDGTTALDSGLSKWITSAAARADGQAWRARACAVLTGIGTVLSDNPLLNVRDFPTPRQPILVVVDSQLRISPDANALSVERPCYIYTAIRDDAKTELLAKAGATVVCLPDLDGKVDLHALVLDLGRRGINELHVEAGSQLNGSFIKANLVDEVLLYLAPRLLGIGSRVAEFGPLAALRSGLDLEFKDIKQIGEDLRLVARVRGHDDF